MSLKFDCIDVGTQYCPCHLAETNECLICSFLKGKDICECNWQGTCVFSEYYWNNNKRKDGRKEYDSKIIDKYKCGINSYIIKIRTNKWLVSQLIHPGSYILIRGKNSNNYYNMPISIMDVDIEKEVIYIAYQVVGIKTKKLEQCNYNVIIKGPYWNGIFGLKNLKKIKSGKCVVIAKGIAQAPVVLTMKKMINDNNEVILFVDKGKVKEFFIDDFIDKNNIQRYEVNLRNDKDKNLLLKTIKDNNIDIIYSSGSDKLHSYVINIIRKTDTKTKLVVTNNNIICCGEGICGACTRRLENGTLIRTCKTQFDIGKEVERGIISG